MAISGKNAILLCIIIEFLIMCHSLKIPALFNLEDRKDCFEDRYEIHNCYTGIENRPSWSRLNEYFLFLTSKCYHNVSYHFWKFTRESDNFIVKFPNKINDMTFTIKPYLLEIGNYTLSVGSTPNPHEGNPCPDDVSKLNHHPKCPLCRIHMAPEDPVAILPGGSEIYTPTRREIIIDGSYSMNLDNKDHSNKGLKYRWWCYEDDDLCKTEDLGTESYIVINYNATIDPKYMFVLLGVRTIYSNWTLEEQRINIVEDAVTLGVNCISNCKIGRLEVSHRTTLFLEAICLRICRESSNFTYEWSMVPGKNNSKPSIDFEKETIYGRYSNKLVIKEYVLSPGDEYTFVVNLTGGRIGVSSKKIELPKLPSCEGCFVRPKSGQSLQDKFLIGCENTNSSQYLYKIYQASENVHGLGVLLGVQWGNKHVKRDLGPSLGSVKIFVKIIEASTNLYTICPLTATVTPFIPPSEPLDEKIEYINLYSDTISRAVTKGKHEQSIGLINTLLDELSLLEKPSNPEEQEKLENVYVNLHFEMLHNLIELPTYDKGPLIQISSIVAKFSKLQLTTKSEPVFAKIHSSLCKKLAKSQTQWISKEVFPDRELELVEVLNNNLFTCVEACSKPNITAIQPPSTPTTTEETPYPPFEENAFTENYPDYTDFDDERHKRLENYEESTINNIKSIRLSGYTAARSLGIGERQYTKIGENVILKATKERNVNLPKNLIVMNETNVTTSRITSNDDDVLEIVIQEWTSNPFWWNETNMNESTKVVDISFFDVFKNKKIVEFVEPIEICLYKTQEENPKWVNGSVSVPSKTSEWEYIDYNMTIHRIDVHRGSTVLVYFKDVKNDINIVLTQGRRPNFDDFDNAITINKSSENVIVNFNQSAKYGDTWFYVAVLPVMEKIDVGVLNATYTVTYSVAFVSPSCNTWDIQKKKWYRTCEANVIMSEKVKICCTCSHLSSFIGIFMNAPNKIDNLLSIDFKMTLQTNWFVFISTCAAFLIYCFFLIFYGRCKQKENLYFLLDNLIEERYAYLITVKTGNKLFAGTTSNVGIIVHGDQKSSNPRILNYPDPERRLLQRGNEDVFILTTLEYLGNIVKINLWMDFVGARPSWYPYSVVVQDLQTDVEWYFKIKSWFYIMHTTNLTVTPSKEDTLTITFLRTKSHLDDAGKITLIFSKVFYSMAFCLLYDFPTLRLSDGFYETKQYLKISIIISACIITCYGLHLFYERLFLIYFVDYNEKNERAEYRNNTPWLLLIVTITISITVLIIFGSFLSYVSGLIWFLLFIFSYGVMCIFYKFCHSRLIYFIESKLEMPIEFETNISLMIKEIEKLRFNLVQFLDDLILNWHFKRKYKMLEDDEIKEKKLKELTRLELKSTYMDIIQFGFYVFLLFAFVLNTKNTISILSFQEMADKLIESNHERKMSFEDIAEMEDFYLYLNVTLIPTLQAYMWYEGWFANQPGLMTDFNTKIIGVVRLRQHRVPFTLCEDNIPGIFIHKNECFPEFSYLTGDYLDHNEFWERKTIEIEYIRRNQYWNYADSSKSGASKTFGTQCHDFLKDLINFFSISTSFSSNFTFSLILFLGTMADYPGGGFLCTLGRKISNTHIILNYIKRTNWIDDRTRALFIEFLTFNVNSNTMNSITLLVERSATEFYKKSYYINTKYTLLTGFDLESISVITLMLICVFVLILKSYFKQVAKTKISYFKNTWNLIDTSIIILTVTSITLHVYRLKLMQDLLDELEESRKNEFINYFDFINFETSLTIIEGILICFSTIKLWKLLRFAVIFRIMETTIRLSAGTLIGTMFYHAIFLSAFALTGCMLFGAFINEFRDIGTAHTTLVVLSVDLFGSFQHEQLRDAMNGYGYCFSVVYSLFTLVIISVYITIIMLAYYKSGEVTKTHFIFYSNKEFLQEEFSYHYNLMKIRRRQKRLRAGTDIIHKPIAFPKENKYRYADVITTSDCKLEAMAGLAKCAIFKKEHKKMDPKLMPKIIYYHFESEKLCEKEEKFFVSSTCSQTKAKLINDSRLLEIELLLNTKVKRNKKDRSGTVSDLMECRNKRIEVFTEALKTMLSVVESIDVE